MTPRHRVDQDAARRLSAEGVSGAEIGRRFHVTKQAISKLVTRWRREAAQTAPARPQPVPAVAPSPPPSPPTPDALLAPLRATKPALLAMLEAHTRVVDRGSALYAYVKTDRASQAAGPALSQQLQQDRAHLTALLGKPLAVAWQ